MKEDRCPFLEIATVTFCKAFPVKKLIPVDRAVPTQGVCGNERFRECPAYREIHDPKSPAESRRGFLLRPDLYLHPRHLWVSLSPEAGGEARVGIDDFAQKLIGRLDRLAVPSEGSPVRENSVCLLAHSGKRSVRMVSPLDGSIQAVNRSACADPSVINRDPYGEGWIFSMHPAAGEGIRNLMHGSVAEKWLDWEVERLQRMFTADLGITATDGGEPLTDLSGRLTEAQWSRIVSLFLG